MKNQFIDPKTYTIVKTINEMKFTGRTLSDIATIEGIEYLTQEVEALGGHIVLINYEGVHIKCKGIWALTICGGELYVNFGELGMKPLTLLSQEQIDGVHSMFIDTLMSRPVEYGKDYKSYEVHYFSTSKQIKEALRDGVPVYARMGVRNMPVLNSDRDKVTLKLDNLSINFNICDCKVYSVTYKSF